MCSGRDMFAIGVHDRGAEDTFLLEYALRVMAQRAVSKSVDRQTGRSRENVTTSFTSAPFTRLLSGNLIQDQHGWLGFPARRRDR
jgi:hypothetical protein